MRNRRDKLKFVLKDWALQRKIYILFPETDVETVIECINEIKPDIVIIDSIQTMNRQDIASAAGSVPQVREATNAFMHIAKSLGISMFIVGHVTKRGGQSQVKESA